MIKNNKNQIVALVPSKKNSTRLKNKNFLKLYKNQTLLEITLNSLKKIKNINKVYVSSDERKAQRIAKDFKVEFINRPKKYCRSNSTANEVISHFAKSIKKNYYNYQNLVCIYLQPTSPFRSYKHIKSALNIFNKKRDKSLVSVQIDSKSIFKSVVISKKIIKPFFNEKFVTSNFQSLKKTYFPNGAIYIFRLKDFLKKNSIPISGSIPFFMSKVASMDIDDKYDFELARLIKSKTKK